MTWHHRNTILALCMLSLFVTFYGRLAVSPVVPLVLEDFGVSNALIGFGLTGMWLAYGLTQFPSGVVADRIGEKPIILLSVAGTAGMSLFIALAPSFSFFVVSIVVLGGLAGLHYSVATTLLSRVFDEIGTALGWHALGVPLAGLVAPPAVAWIGVRYGWRPAVATTAIVGLPVFVLFLWRVRSTEPRRPNRPMRDQFGFDSIRRSLSRPAVAYTVSIAVVATFVVNGVTSFLPTFLVEYHGHSPSLAGIGFSAYFVIHGGGQIAVGTASDSVDRDLVIASCMVLGSAGFALLVLGTGALSIATALPLIGIGMSFYPALDSRFLDEFAGSERGAEFGLVRTVYGVLGATGSLGTGLFADLFGWGASFAMLAVSLSLVFCVLVANWALGLGY